MCFTSESLATCSVNNTESNTLLRTSIAYTEDEISEVMQIDVCILCT